MPVATPETKAARDLIRRAVVRTLDRMSPSNASGPAELGPPAVANERLYDKLQELSPGSEAQRSLRAEALRMSTELGNTLAALRASVLNYVVY